MLAGSLNLMFSLSWLTKNVWPTAATVAKVMHINWEDRKRELIWLKSTIYGFLLKISHTITLKFPICFCFHYKTPKEWVVNYYTKLICILNHGSHSWIKETGWFLWPLDPEFIVYPLTFVALELTLTFNLTDVSGMSVGSVTCIDKCVVFTSWSSLLEEYLRKSNIIIDLWNNML